VAGIHARLHGIGADGAVAERTKSHERGHDERAAPEPVEPVEPEPAER
jgi:hypothetical protein